MPELGQLGHRAEAAHEASQKKEVAEQATSLPELDQVSIVDPELEGRALELAERRGETIGQTQAAMSDLLEDIHEGQSFPNDLDTNDIGAVETPEAPPKASASEPVSEASEPATAESASGEASAETAEPTTSEKPEKKTFMSRVTAFMEGIKGFTGKIFDAVKTLLASVGLYKASSSKEKESQTLEEAEKAKEQSLEKALENMPDSKKQAIRSVREQLDESRELAAYPNLPFAFAVPKGFTPLVTSGFGMRTLSGQMESHNGVDIAFPNGTPIYAVEGMRIIDRGFDATSLSGNYVKVQLPNGDILSLSHLEKPVEKTGFLQPGEVLAYTGNTGRSTGPHLHMAFRDGTEENPAQANGPYADPSSLMLGFEVREGVDLHDHDHDDDDDAVA